MGIMGESSAAHYSVFETAGRFCAVVWTRVGIRGFLLPELHAASIEEHVLARHSMAKPAAPPPVVTRLIEDVRRYFAGQRVDFSGIALDLGAQCDSWRRIYAAARRVGWGQTTTYGALAKELHAHTKFARDVGQAMAKNPVPLIIPCHRVLAAGGKLGGFSAPGGTTAKMQMLRLEDVRVAAPPPAQQSFEL
jgi:methylated-DNA-[protein]-cysteine S-methyltransferase